MKYHQHPFIPLFKNSNLHHEEIIIKAVPISPFLVYDGLNADLDAIAIYRRIKTLENLNKPAIQALLTFICECTTRQLVDYTGNFIPPSVFVEPSPPAASKGGLNKFNTTLPTLCTPRQEPGPASARPAAFPDINLNLFQHFLSALKLPGISPPPTVTNSPIEPIIEDIYDMCREEIDLHLKLCKLNAGGKASLPPYLRHLNGKHVSDIIQYQIITSQLRNTEHYYGHHVPLPATILKTTKKRKDIS